MPLSALLRHLLRLEAHISFHYFVFLKFESEKEDKEVTCAVGTEIYEAMNLRFINSSGNVYISRYMCWIICTGNVTTRVYI
jgi:hypothetical protein